MQKDFWRNSKVAVLGGGSWGTVLAQLAAENARSVRLWVRNEENARRLNSTRINSQYLPQMQLSERIQSMSQLDRVFEGGVDAIIWALPSSVCRAQAREVSKYIRGSEILLHATKGVEEGTLKRISQVLREELPCPRIGVVSGPNLAAEVARGEPAAAVVASSFQEVIEAGVALLSTPRFRIYTQTDVVGVEWAGTLKNILAIAAGALDELKLGWNARAMLLTRGLAEMVRFGCALGAEEETFLGLAGMGDLMATCSSPLSRNYRVGAGLARGEPLEEILKNLHATAEGVRTARTVAQYAELSGIQMPITQGVARLVDGKVGVKEAIDQLMRRPPMKDGPGLSSPN